MYTVQSVRTLHYSTFIEPQRQTWRSPLQGRQSDKRGRDSRRLRDWADLETGKWRVADSALAPPDAQSKRNWAVVSLWPSVAISLHFIVECLLLPTALFASLSLSLSRLFDRLRRRATIDLECHGANSKARRDALDSPRRCR